EVGTTRAHSIAVTRLHGMEQSGVRLPVGPPRNISALISLPVAQRTEQIRPKDKMGVQFPPGRKTTKRGIVYRQPRTSPLSADRTG
ncbi:MAG: hypothetical protein UY73_C0024G0009, partial [Parcubacteria group bacterium GW2011_GWA2_52_8]